MRAPLDPFSFVLTSIAGWMNQHQQHVIEYLMEENRVLREGLFIHFDDEGLRLAPRLQLSLGERELVPVLIPLGISVWSDFGRFHSAEKCKNLFGKHTFAQR